MSGAGQPSGTKVGQPVVRVDVIVGQYGVVVGVVFQGFRVVPRVVVVVVCGATEVEARIVVVRSLDRINVWIEVRGMVGEVREDDKRKTRAYGEENHDDTKFIR